MQNPNCDGSGPCNLGEVRVLPIGAIPDHGNMILCRLCFSREMNWREDRNRELAKDCRFDLPRWESLEVYGTGGANLWAAIRKAGIEYSSHESDLYLPDRPEVWAIIDRFPVQKGIARRFKHQPDGASWVDVPFAYLPWWKAREEPDYMEMQRAQRRGGA
jgi:hypothetical protein